MNRLNRIFYNFLSWRYINSWPHNFKQIFRNIKYCWQRATKGYCDADLWNFDSFLATVISEGLKDFNKKRHGHPGTTTDEEWSKVLEEMSLLFHNCLEENDAYKNPYEDEYDRAVNDSFANATDHSLDSFYFELNIPNELREAYYIEDSKIFDQRKADKDAGFDLLKFWFFNLWD